MIANCHRPTNRPGFTLLEVLLASAIGVILLGALYVAFDLTLSRTDLARKFVRNSDLSRAIVSRMNQDFSGCLGPLQPKSGGGIPAESSSGSGGTTGGTTGETTGGTTTGDTAAVVDALATGTTDVASLAPAETEAASDVPFQGGVFGTDKQLTIFVSRVPTDLVNPESAALTEAGGDPKPDLRRVSYYLGSNGGLCRQEQFLVTADGVRNSTEPDLSREAQDLIAEEVTDITFDYFDGTSWTTSWTGSDSTEDGKSVIGPPRAIRVTMSIRSSNGQTKRCQHVFPVRAALGLYEPPVMDTTTTTEPTTTTEGM